MINRQDIWEAYEGRCFYCNGPTRFRGRTFDRRDWLLPRNAVFAKEHETPLSRGGADHESNYLPSCQRCNAEKGQMTRREYRFLKGLRGGSLNFTFPHELEPVARDWLCCHSANFERRLLTHNMAMAA